MIFLSNLEKKHGNKKIIYYLGSSTLLFFMAFVNCLNWIIFPEFSINWLQITLFYSILYRPILFPWIVFFPLTLLQDFFLTFPFGITMIFSFFLTLILINQKKLLHKINFYGIWLYFGLLLGLTEISTFLTVSYIKNYTFQLSSVFNISFLASWLIYPLASIFIRKNHKIIRKLGLYYGT